MKISKIFAGMSALALSAAMFSTVAVSADDAPTESGFYNATYSGTFTYAGSDIAATSPELNAWEAKTVIGEGEDAKEYQLYNSGWNIQLGHMKNAHLTIKVTSSTNNIWNGTEGVSEGYMYTVQKSWEQNAPADDVAGDVPFMFNEDGTPKQMKGATYLNNWDSGPSKFNGQWAQITLTDNDLSALTFEVTVECGSDAKWEYHPYDTTKSEEENCYIVFRMGAEGNLVRPTSGDCADLDGWNCIVSSDTINEQFGGVTSKTAGTESTASAADSSSSADPSSSDGDSKGDTTSSSADSKGGSGSTTGDGTSTDTSSSADSTAEGESGSGETKSSDSSSSAAAASASSSSSTAAASATSSAASTTAASTSTKSSTTTTTTTTSSSAAAPAGGGSDGSAESDATSNAASGAAAGVGLAITAAAAAAIVVTKKRN